MERGLDASTETTHRLVVQDDIYVCDHFRETVEAAAAARPGDVLVFFVAGHPHIHAREVRRSLERGWSWAVLDNTTWCPVVATAWPVGIVRPMLDWVGRRFETRQFPPAFTADDEIVGRYLRDAGVRALASVPSLVEHPDSVRSIASDGHRDRGGLDPSRRALVFVEDDPDLDPLRIDWSAGPGDAVVRAFV